MKKIFLHSLEHVPGYFLGIFVILSVLALFVPLGLSLPNASLDGSWAFALNVAMEQGLVFGKDIIFSSGPYASIYTRQFHPATDHLMILGSILIGVSYAVMLLLLSQNVKPRWVIFYVVFMIIYWHFPDPWLFSYTFLLSLLTYRFTLPDVHSFKLRWSRFYTTIYSFLFIPLGLLPLIKGTFFINCIVTVFLCCALLYHSKQKRLAYFIAALPVATGISFWLISGQPLNALPVFLFNIFPIISGYTEAMAYSGKIREIIFYLLSLSLVIYAIVKNEDAPKTSNIFLLLFYIFFFFIIFKSSFTRHDAHAIYGGSAIIIAALSINFVIKIKEKLLFYIIITSVLTFWIIDQKSRGTSTTAIYESLNTVYVTAFEGANTRLTEPEKLVQAFNERINEIHKKFPVPFLKGSTDIYSYQQTELLASKNTWSPRPIFQSYSAYTPKLQELNRQHLLGATAPDNIIFRVQTIDDRFPALDDGLSWPVIINNYSIVKTQGDALYLKKKASLPIIEAETVLYNERHQLDEEVTLPYSKDPVFAVIDVQPTFLNKIASVLFKANKLYITVTLADGKEQEFRFISAMGKSRFLLSPLIENTEEFSLLASSGNKRLAHKMIKKIKISTSFGKHILWDNEYSITLLQVD